MWSIAASHRPQSPLSVRGSDWSPFIHWFIQKHTPFISHNRCARVTCWENTSALNAHISMPTNSNPRLGQHSIERFHWVYLVRLYNNDTPLTMKFSVSVWTHNDVLMKKIWLKLFTMLQFSLANAFWNVFIYLVFYLVFFFLIVKVA